MSEAQLLEIIRSASREDTRSLSQQYDAREALEQILRAHYDWIARMCFYELNDKNLAGDCVQEIMIEISKSICGFDGRSTLKTWIFSIARRTIYRMRKKQAKRSSRLVLMSERARGEESGPGAEIKAEQSNPEEKNICGEQGEQLVRLVQQLPEKQRYAVMLHYFEDMSVEDAAKSLKCSPASLKTHLFRARKKLKAMVEQSGYEFDFVKSGDERAK